MKSNKEENNKKTVISIIVMCLLGSAAIRSIPLYMSGKVNSLLPIALVAVCVVVGSALKITKTL